MVPESLYPKGVEGLLPEIQKQLDKLEGTDFITRFNRRDNTLWSNDPAQQQEISQRLGWLDATEKSKSLVPEGQQLLEELLKEGYTHAVILGMGGSSLAPEVYSLFAETYGLKNPKHLSVSILDSTSPEQILRKQAEIPLGRTIFIVSSKSGTTVEVNTLFAYFWAQVEKIDPENAGGHFVAIGDPGTKIQKLAAEKRFRKVIEADPNVGGRYSALIAFGLIPAILAGYDGNMLLSRSLKYSQHHDSTTISYEDGGVQLGVVLGAAYSTGRDKLTLLVDAQTASLGSWIEQLVAESSGKDGRGILPVADEPLQIIDRYGTDRLFVYLRKDGAQDILVRDLIEKSHPVFICEMGDLYDLSTEFYRWEIATAVACILINVNAFDQPNVQESKDITKQLITALKNNKTVEVGTLLWKSEEAAIFGRGAPGNEAAEILNRFLAQRAAGDFIAINAFVARSAENEQKLQAFRKSLADLSSLPTTLGFGPRFLHSTGQLHKGGKNNGLFVVISQEEQERLTIPGEGITFNDLIQAQALGDTQALERHERRVIRLHFHAGVFGNYDLNALFE